MHRSLTSALTLGLLAGSLSAQFTISEALINPPGSDDGREAIEIVGAPNTKLTGYYLLAIEGDGANAGTVDTVIDLNAHSTGSNGLLLLRDSTTALVPAPAAGTTIAVDAAAFTNDIENGTITLVLGSGTAPAKTTDLDTDNDGKLDNGIPGFTVVDAVSWTDGGSSDHMYAGTLGGYDFPNSRTFTPDAVYRIYDAAGNAFCWVGADVLTGATAPNGPFDFDWAGFDYQGGLSQGFGPQALNLGSPNGTLQLCTEEYGISQASGGSQKHLLNMGAANANGIFLLLGSLSGTTPGIQISPSLTVPVNLDAYTQLLLSAPNSLLNPSVGILDAQGRATASFALPANSPAMVGMTFNHAALVLDSSFSRFVAASNPATLFIQN